MQILCDFENSALYAQLGGTCPTFANLRNLNWTANAVVSFLFSVAKVKIQLTEQVWKAWCYLSCGNGRPRHRVVMKKCLTIEMLMLDGGSMLGQWIGLMVPSICPPHPPRGEGNRKWLKSRGSDRRIRWRGGIWRINKRSNLGEVNLIEGGMKLIFSRTQGKRETTFSFFFLKKSLQM